MSLSKLTYSFVGLSVVFAQQKKVATIHGLVTELQKYGWNFHIGALSHIEL